MTRQEYMQQLAALLAAMPEAERRDALDYYEEYFDAAGPEKEAQTIQELGSPQNVAEKIWEGTGAQFGTPMPDNSMPEQGSRRRKSPVWIVLAILAILIVVLLVFIGVKMLIHDFFEIDAVSSLIFIILVLLVSIGASVVIPQKKEALENAK